MWKTVTQNSLRKFNMLTGKVWNRTAIRVLEFPFTDSVFYRNMFPSILEKCLSESTSCKFSNKFEFRNLISYTSSLDFLLFLTLSHWFPSKNRTMWPIALYAYRCMLKQPLYNISVVYTHFCGTFNLLGVIRHYSGSLYWLIRSPFELNDLFHLSVLWQR